MSRSADHNAMLRTYGYKTILFESFKAGNAIVAPLKFNSRNAVIMASNTTLYSTYKHAKIYSSEEFIGMDERRRKALTHEMLSDKSIRCFAIDMDADSLSHPVVKDFLEFAWMFGNKDVLVVTPCEMAISYLPVPSEMPFAPVGDNAFCLSFHPLHKFKKMSTIGKRIKDGTFGLGFDSRNGIPVKFSDLIKKGA